MNEEWMPVRFIDEEIEPWFREPPLLKKKPSPPDGFSWGGRTFEVRQMLASWFDARRKGRMAHNMQPGHARVAQRRGSWGVGRFFFRLQTSEGRVFDVYYDRAPKDAGDRAGHWILWRELEAS